MANNDLDQIRELAFRYAQAVDRRNLEQLAACFTPEIEIIVPGAPAMRGPGLAARIIEMVSGAFTTTQHRVFNLLCEIDGDTASGETYCSALHLLPADTEGRVFNLEMCIRYQDELARVDGRWQYRRRELLVDWQEQRPVLTG